MSKTTTETTPTRLMKCRVTDKGSGKEIAGCIAASGETIRIPEDKANYHKGEGNIEIIEPA